MSARELVVLGTASQVPTRYRNHNGYLLRWDGEGMLFDPGEGTQRQMILFGISVSAITRILITHFHGDHCLGLAGICQRLALDRVTHDVPVHYPASGQKYYERLRHASIFRDVAPTVPQPITAPGEIAAGPLRIETLPLDHAVDSWGFRIAEPDGRSLVPELLDELGIAGPAVGELQRAGRIEIDGRTVTVDEVSVARRGQVVSFVMDTRHCANAVELARGADLLVCESTFLAEDADKAHEFGHLTAGQAASIAAEAGADRLVLTHFSQRYTGTDRFLEEAGPIHPNVVAASDGDRIELPHRERPANARRRAG